MTVPFRTFDELKAWLNEAGWEVVNDEFFHEFDRLVFGKDGHTVPIQFKKTYFFGEVVRICNGLKIAPPADCLKCYEQYRDAFGETSEGEAE